MPQAYTVKVVSGKEFDRIAKSDSRYSQVNEDNLGFADPEKGIAWVLYTAMPGLNEYLVNHEFEHLLNPEDGADKDSNGIYHKKTFQALARVGEIFTPEWSRKLPLIGPALTAQRDVARGNTSFGKVFSAFGVPVLEGAALGATAGLSGFGQGTPSVIGANAARGIQPVESVVGPQIGRSLLTPAVPTSSAAINQPPGLFSSAANQSPGLFSRFSQGLSQFGSKLKNIFGGGGLPPGGPNSWGGPQNVWGPQPNSATGASGTAPGWFNRIFGGGNLPMTAAGLGLGLFGQRAGKAPEIPSFNTPSVQAVRSQAGQPISEVAKQATARLQGRLAQTPESTLQTPEMQTITSDIRRQYDEARHNLYSQYQLSIPGTDLSNNSSYQRASRDLDRSEAAAIAQVQQQRLSEFNTQQGQDIAQGLGVDTQTLSTLMDLAQLDVAEIMAKTGLKAQQAQDFRNMFSQLGSILVARGVGASMAPFYGVGKS